LASEPDRVLNPDSADYKFSIVGSAMPQKMGDRAQIKMAEMAARKEFAANKSTYIETKQTSYRDSEGNTDFQSDTYLNSAGLLNFSTMSKIKEWKDPNSGELFFLYAIE
jgi:hypothetical protein